MENYIIDMTNRKIDLIGRQPFMAKTTVPIPPSAFDPREDTVLYWLGGGGFLLNSRGTILMLDPVIETDGQTPRMAETGQKMLMDFPLSARQVPRCDAVLYTHADLDHVGPATSRILSEKRIRRLAPYPVALSLMEYGVHSEDISPTRPGDRYDIGTVHIDVIPSDHPWQLLDPALYGKPFRRGDTCAYVVYTPDGGFLFLGDTRLIEEHLHIPGIDVVTLDTCDCAFHLSRTGAIVLANHYADAYLIPYHYGVFDEPSIPAQEQGDPALVFAHVNTASARARTIAPGEPFFIHNKKEVN